MFKKIGLSLLALFIFSAGFAAGNMNLPKQQKIYTITLPSNPTTGYSWFIQAYDHDSLILKAHRYLPAETKRVGAGGLEEWQFVATPQALRAPHVVPVTLIYARPWELKSGAAKGVQTKTVNLVIH